jgi:hypothetical protein
MPEQVFPAGFKRRYFTGYAARGYPLLHQRHDPLLNIRRSNIFRVEVLVFNSQKQKKLVQIVFI